MTESNYDFDKFSFFSKINLDSLEKYKNNNMDTFMLPDRKWGNNCNRSKRVMVIVSIPMERERIVYIKGVRARVHIKARRNVTLICNRFCGWLMAMPLLSGLETQKRASLLPPKYSIGERP